MIKVGGNSYNDGIRFSADKFSVNFVQKNNTTKIFLKENIKEKTNKVLDFLEKIPFVRSLAAIYRANKFLFFILFSSLIQGIYLSCFFSSTIFESQAVSTTSIISTIYITSLMLITIASLFMLGMMVIKILFNAKATAMYHGAEHKVIYTYYDEKDLTLENCRKSPRVNDNCGTMLVVLLFSTEFIMSRLIDIFNIRTLSYLTLFISFSVAYELFLLDRNTPIIRYLFKIGYWFQEKLFTREPSDYQLSTAIEAFNLLLKAEKGEIPENELKELLINGKKAKFLDKFF